MPRRLRSPGPVLAPKKFLVSYKRGRSQHSRPRDLAESGGVAPGAPPGPGQRRERGGRGRAGGGVREGPRGLQRPGSYSAEMQVQTADLATWPGAWRPGDSNTRRSWWRRTVATGAGASLGKCRRGGTMGWAEAGEGRLTPCQGPRAGVWTAPSTRPDPQQRGASFRGRGQARGTEPSPVLSRRPGIPARVRKRVSPLSGSQRLV